jgi:hypothetical protein
MRASAHSPMYSRGHRVLFAQTNAAPLQCDLSSADPLAVRSLWPKVGGERSLGHIWRWAYRRSAGERGQGIHATNNLAATPLSRENREALSCPMKAVPRFCATSVCWTGSVSSCVRVASPNSASRIAGRRRTQRETRTGRGLCASCKCLILRRCAKSVTRCSSPIGGRSYW